MDYKIFNYDWDDSNGDNFDISDSKLANADPNTGIDISGAFYVDFTLSGENIFAITSNYENFYIYWKATDSANNISYKKQEVRITDDTFPTYDTPNTIYQDANNDNNTPISLPRLVVADNVGVQYLQYKRKEVATAYYDQIIGIRTRRMRIKHCIII